MVESRAATGRADMVRALVALGEEGLASTARFLGFGEEPEAVAGSPAPSAEEVQPVISRRPETKSADPSEMALLPFWRLEVRETLEELPLKRAEDEAELLSLEELEPTEMAPEPAPLVPWSRLWPALHQALRSTVPSREIDVEALVERWSRGDTPARLPRRAAFAWSRRLTLAVDRSPRLIPFWHDQDQLCRALRQRLGSSGLDVIRSTGGSRAPWAAGHCRRVPGPASAATGKTVLLLGDLGIYGEAEERATWARLGRILRRRGARPRALVPCPTARWAPELARLWRAVDWSSPLGAQVGSCPSESKLRARCERLLNLVSPALRVEPGLLRAIRRLLPAWDADAGTEADVWSHPDVDGGSSVAMRVETSADRQAAFRREDKALRQRVIEEIRRWHAALPKEIWREEGLRLVFTGGGADGALPEAEVQEVVSHMLRLSRTVQEEGDVRKRRAVERYFVRVGERLPDSVWADPELGAPFARAWGVVRRRRKGLSLPPGVSPALLGDTETRIPRRWTAWQVGSSLLLRSEGESPDPEPGSPLATFWAAGPEIGVAAGQVWQQPLELGGGARPLPRSSTLILMTDRERVELRRFVKPLWASAIGRDRIGLWATVEVEDVAFRLRWIPPGRFLMGSPDDEAGRWDDEGPQHELTLTRGFWLAETPCTQALWEAVMAENPSRFQSPDRPVEQVSWNDCQSYLETLNSRFPGLELRLPTEAEWEYACRAGTETSIYAGDLDRIAWYYDNSGEETHPVAQKEPNTWGLYDTLGNVLEWCSDFWRASYEAEAVEDPQGPSKGSGRVFRGGSWIGDARHVRAAYRFANVPGGRDDYLGFRLARGQEE